jgi:hypothetical protein
MGWYIREVNIYKNGSFEWIFLYIIYGNSKWVVEIITIKIMNTAIDKKKIKHHFLWQTLNNNDELNVSLGLTHL